MSNEQDTSIYHERSEFIAAAKAPEYSTSAHYRAGVEAKLARSLAAGSITPMGQVCSVEQTTSRPNDRRHSFLQEDVMYGVGNPMPGPDPMMLEVQEVGRVGTFFKDREAVVRAMSAPHYHLDDHYRRDVQAKITRSIRDGWIDTNWQAIPRIAVEG